MMVKLLVIKGIMDQFLADPAFVLEISEGSLLLLMMFLSPPASHTRIWLIVILDREV